MSTYEHMRRDILVKYILDNWGISNWQALILNMPPSLSRAIIERADSIVDKIIHEADVEDSIENLIDGKDT